MNIKVLNKEPANATRHESFIELFEQIARNSVSVVQDEIELVKQRVREKMNAVRSGVITVAIGLAVGFAAFLSLCAASIIGLTSYMTPAGAAVVIGAVLAFIGVVIAVIGFKQLKQSILKT